MFSKSVIHIAPDIGYLFNPSDSRTLCGQIVSDVFAAGEFIGLYGNLNIKCAVCPKCGNLTGGLQAQRERDESRREHSRTQEQIAKLRRDLA